MNIDAGIAISVIAAVAALLSWFEARRMYQITKSAFLRQSFEKVETLPSVEALGIVKVGGKTRAKLMVFNQRDMPYRVNCVKCYAYDPKPRNLANFFRSHLGPFDWDYSYQAAFWNPKGTLDDDEHYIEDTLRFTLVKETELLLVTLTDTDPDRRYRFEVITSQGTTCWEGVLPNCRTLLPHDHVRSVA